MSVLVCDRKESTMQYVSNARMLMTNTIKRCLRFPKRLTFFISTNLVNCSQQVYEKVLLAKELYGKYEERIMLIKECIAKLKYMLTLLDVVMEMSKQNGEIKTKTIFNWTQEITEEMKLLNGVIKKDNEKLGSV